MKMLICGVGGIARELLRQLGDGWEVTLIDKDPAQLQKARAVSADILATLAEDATSPLALRDAGIERFDYVLALAARHEVNRAVADIALEAGVPHVAVLVDDPEVLRELRGRGVHALMAGKLVAGEIYHYLQDPRVRLTPLSLGLGSLMEVRAADHQHAVGKRVAHFNRRRSRLVGLFRDDRLVFPRPDMVIKADDRLVILGDHEVFQQVCGLLECGSPHFPLAYGPGMLVVVPEAENNGQPQVLVEAQHLAQSVQVKAVRVLGGDPGADYLGAVSDWPQNVTPEVTPLAGDVAAAVRGACADGNFGLVVMPEMESVLPSFLSGAAYVGLAHDIARPLLVARGTSPYGRILVPFSGTAMAELALEVAVDLSRQTGCAVAAVVVEQPDFLTGDEDSAWKRATLERLRELSHIHKTNFELLERRGNPVREIGELTKESDLLVLGSTNRERGLFTPNVGESLTRAARCSVLLLAI
jgi:Trk K+ transport system NAD-binding subunit